MTPSNLSRLLRDVPSSIADRPALISDSKKLTYRELGEAVEKLADAWTSSLGLGAGDRVALLLPNGLEFAIAYLATARIGAVAVPLNPQFTAAELADILDECTPRVVVALPELVEVVESARSRAGSIEKIVVTGNASDDAPRASGVSSFDGLLAGGSPRPVSKPPAEDDLAVLLYTSGTTGKPKGIMLSHRNITANVESLARVRTWSDHETFLTVLPLFHGYAATAMLLLGLRLGATNVLESRFVPPRILECIESYRVTFFAGVPPMYSVFLKTCDPAHYDLSSCRTFLSGAAPLPMPLFEAFRDRFGVEIVEGYGPQECSPVVSVNPMLGPVRPGTVGPPIPDVEVRITDPTGQQCATGQDGEICVRGENVMLGYYDKPRDTAAVMRDGWYRTGDMGRLDADGFLSITGRIKEMVIVKGENVYPAEVEAAVLEHEDVVDVAVKGMPDEVRGERVVAFVVARENAARNAKPIVEYCLQRLAGYKVPHDVRFIESIPRSAAGKILRLDLPDT